MGVPSPFELLLLLGLTFRLVRLIGWDDLTHPLRVLVTGMGDREHHHKAQLVDSLMDEGIRDPWAIRIEGERLPSRGRFYISRMIRCPWCMSVHIAVAVSVLFWVWPEAALYAALPAILSSGVGLVAKWLDP